MAPLVGIFMISSNSHWSIVTMEQFGELACLYYIRKKDAFFEDYFSNNQNGALSEWLDFVGFREKNRKVEITGLIFKARPIKIKGVLCYLYPKALCR